MKYINALMTSCVFTHTALAFTMIAPKTALMKTKLFMSDDQPSDSSSEFTVDVESDEIKPTTESEMLAMNLLDDLPSSLSGDIDNDIRTRINEELIKIEALNPTESPAMSNLLNGVWTLRYSGGYTSDWALPSPTRQIALFLYSGGYSPGLFLLTLAQQLPESIVDVGELQISISRDQPRIEATVDVDFFGNTDSSQKITLNAIIDVLSDVHIRETYEKFASVLDREVAIPEQLQYSRDLYITYLDDDLLVVRDASVVPEILVRN